MRCNSIMKTIKQLADKNKVSKTTIRRYMKKINADAVTNENGISLIDDDTANVKVFISGTCNIYNGNWNLYLHAEELQAWRGAWLCQMG